MAQTLTALVAPTTSPIKQGSTNVKTLIGDWAALNNLDDRMLKCIAILGRVHELYLSLDYRTNHKQLIQDAMVFFSGIPNMNDRNYIQFQAAIDWNAGLIGDVGIGTSVLALVKEARDIANLSEDELNRILLLLRMQMAV